MKPRLKYTEIYITNVCNYSCTNCQSLNNFAFKGHQRWKDYESEYRSLSDRIDIDQIQIIGGEPTLNPDFEKWVSGISDLWPNAKLQIATNGTRLDKLTKDIYQILLKRIEQFKMAIKRVNIFLQQLRNKMIQVAIV